MDSSSIIGRAPEQLTLAERSLLAGKWIALEIYTPATLPLRRIEAVGGAIAACAAELRRRQLNPGDFEFVLVKGRP
jgi:hypothetical protein